MARLRVSDIDQALAAYVVEHRRCPSTRDDLVTDGFIKPVTFVDPWGTSIAYWCSEDRSMVVSAGPDKQFGTDDDITRNR